MHYYKTVLTLLLLASITSSSAIEVKDIAYGSWNGLKIFAGLALFCRGFPEENSSTDWSNYSAVKQIDKLRAADMPYLFLAAAILIIDGGKELKELWDLYKTKKASVTPNPTENKSEPEAH